MGKLSSFKRYCQVATQNTGGVYYCTRDLGHEGPCAAVPVVASKSFDRDLTDEEQKFFATQPSPEDAGYWQNDDEGDEVNPVDSKIATAFAKVGFQNVTLCELTGVARVKTYGAKKHGHGNYYNAHLDDGAAARYMGGLLRHVAAMQEPNGTWTAESITKLDDESGLPEIDHAICGLLMLRGIAVKSGAMSQDPGVGNEPPKP